MASFASSATNASTPISPLFLIVSCYYTIQVKMCNPSKIPLTPCTPCTSYQSYYNHFVIFKLFIAIFYCYSQARQELDTAALSVVIHPEPDPETIQFLHFQTTSRVLRKLCDLFRVFFSVFYSQCTVAAAWTNPGVFNLSPMCIKSTSRIPRKSGELHPHVIF